MAPGKKSGLEMTTLGGRGTTSVSTGETATLALTILGHPCVERVGDRAVLDLLASGEPLLLSRTNPLFAPPGLPGGEPLADEHLSRTPLRLTTTGDGGVRLAIGQGGTAVVVRGQRLHDAALFSAAQIQRGVVLELGHRVVLLLHAVAPLQDILAPPAAADREILGESDAVRRVLWEIGSVADLALPVLLRGETGTGKELVARALHRGSPRNGRPFVTVNVGAVTSSLAVAALFGAERGAFTGAVQRQTGYFEQARGGALFLDEIGEAPAELQTALLRVLETGEMQTVGAQQARKTDVRVIAATDANLEEKVAVGAFRAPLLNRLSAYEIWIPPLRERRDDIGRLLVSFLREELRTIGEPHRLHPPAPGNKPWLPASLVARLADHDWPGNVRQLRNVVRQLVVGSRGRDRLEATAAVHRLLTEPAAAAPSPAGAVPTADAPSEIERASAPVVAGLVAEADMSSDPAAPARRPAQRKPATVTEAELGEALRACRWDLAAAAQHIGVSRASMYVLIKRYPRFRTAGDLTPEAIESAHRVHAGDLARMAEQLEVSERALGRRVRELGLG